MKLKLIVWMIGIMLALPFASALFPYSPAGNTAPNDAFMKSSNESFNTGDSMVNWSVTNGNLCTSTEGNLVCPAKTNGGHEANYIHELINPLTNAGLNGGNFTIFEGDIRVIDGSGTGFVVNARSVNYTGAGNWYDNSVLSLRMQGATSHGATCPATTPAGSDKSSVAMARWGDSAESDAYDSINGLCADGTLNHLQIVISSVNDGTAYAFLNGTLVSTITPLENQGGTVKAFPLFWTFGVGAYSNWASFNVSNYVTFNGSIYNMSGAAPPIPEPDEQQFTITAADTYDAESLKNITITIFNSSNSYDFTTGNGTVLVSNKTSIESFNVTYNITFSSNQSGGYLNHTIPNINLSDGGSFIGDLYQAILRVNATEIISGTQIVDFLASVPLQSNQSTGGVFIPTDHIATLLLKAGNYNVTGNKTGYINSTSSISINALDDTTLTLEFATHILKLNATSILNNQPISAFTINIENSSYLINKTATDKEVSFNLIEGIWNITFDHDGHEIKNVLINLNATSKLVNYTFFVYTFNSVNLSFSDEILGKNGFFSNTTVDFSFVSDAFANNYSTQNGSFYVDLLSPSDYRISYTSGGYIERDYYFGLSNRTHNAFDLYLLSTGNSSNIDVTIQDENARGVVNATIKLLRYYETSNSYVVVAMSRTDSSAKSRFNIEEYNAFYYFVIEKDGITLLSTTPSRIIETSLSFSVFIGANVLAGREGILKVSHELTFSNVTQQFRFVYSDAGNILKEACLDVERITPQNTYDICNTCQSSTSGTIICTVNTSQSGFHRAYGRVDTTTKSSPYILDVLDSISDEFRESIATFGSMGAYLTAYLIMALALLGTPFPYLSIILAIIGIIFASITGILGMGYMAIASIVLLGAIIMFKIRN